MAFRAMAIKIASVALATGFGLVVLLAGCAPQTPGDTASPAPTQEPTMKPTPSLPSSPSEGEQLTIRYDNGRDSVQTWTLTCDPDGGDHPDAQAACKALADHESALQPVPADRQCTQQYGGPETATITGTWGGKRVNAMLSRTNGCEIARWDDLAGLLPKAST